ncbi:MAG TPA: alpha/beta fold hydrolase [Puia sp.]|nr:alpha/beta fold hydrolase [Puia sp.]
MIKIFMSLAPSAFAIAAAFGQNAISVADSSGKVISIPAKECIIAGTLLSSEKIGNQPLAIIIAGSGPTDRNGNSTLGISPNSYKLLAESLAADGIASFRYDKREVGKSMMKNFREANLRFETYIDDALAIYDYLHDSLGYSKIFFVGHSEGSLIGMVASSRRPVRGFISLSGAGRPIDVVIDEQLSAQPEGIRKKVDSIFDALKAGHAVDSVPVSLRALLRPNIQPYIMSWLKYDPEKVMAQLRCPALVVQGACDIQVKVLDAENLHKGDPKSKLDIIPSMTHTLKDAGPDCKDENYKTYTDGSLPLDAQLVKDLGLFIHENS